MGRNNYTISPIPGQNTPAKLADILTQKPSRRSREVRYRRSAEDDGDDNDDDEQETGWQQQWCRSVFTTVDK